MAANDSEPHCDPDATIMALAEAIRHAGDLAPLMAGSLDERIETIIALCKGLPAIAAAAVHLVDEEARTFTGGTAKSRPRSEEGSQAPPWPSPERLAQVAASARACYATREPKEPLNDRRRVNKESTPESIYMLPLGPRERVLGILLLGTRRAGGIPIATRRTLDLLAPLFFLALENACLGRHAPSPAAQDRAPEGQRPGDILDPSRVDPIAHLAHELKNAMTTVSTFLQLLPAKWGEAQFRSTFYPSARDESLRINGLVNAMLDGQPQQPPARAFVDLQAVLQHILARKTPLAEQRRLRLHFHADPALPTLFLDQDAIAEAIGNLLSNAMEASPRGGRIDLRLTGDAMSNGQPAVRLDIQDSGPGVAKALREAIFAPYVTTKRRGASTGGTGLGLAIARRHIEAHGGRIAVETPAGGGALFRVLLPVERRRHP